MYNRFKKISSCILLILINWNIIAQNTATEVLAEPGVWESIHIVDKMLMLIAIGLLIPIFYLSRIFNWSLKHYLNNKLSNKLNTVLLIGLWMIPSLMNAQGSTQTTPSYFDNFNFLRWFLLFIIAMEVFILGFFGKILFNQFELFEGREEERPTAKSWIVEWWNKMNNFGSKEDEDRIDTGHNYDGIRELDNNIPAWFTAAFIASMLFAVIYMWQYHIAKIAPLSDEEYQLEMEAAELAHQQYLKTAGSSIDENKLVLSTEKSDIEEGKKLYVANCAACHLADGGGQAGPNLTDDSWINGCSAKDIYQSIKYGRKNGMMAWKDNFNDDQIVKIASFVKSLQGSKPYVAKATQGTVCSMMSDISTNAVKDSTAADSTKK